MSQKPKLEFSRASDRLERAERTTREAKAQITAENAARNAKTARLRELRLAQEEANQSLTPAAVGLVRSAAAQRANTTPKAAAKAPRRSRAKAKE